MSQIQNHHTSFNELSTYHRKERILDVAAELFAMKGYDAVTTAELSLAAGCSEFSLFKLFPTKNHIYNEMFDEWKYMISKQEEIPIVGNSAIGTLDKVYTELMADIFRRNSFIRPYLEQAVYSRKTDGARQRILDALCAIPDYVEVAICPIIERGQAVGDVRCGDPLELAQLFWSISAGAQFLERTFPGRYSKMPFSDFSFIFKESGLD